MGEITTKNFIQKITIAALIVIILTLCTAPVFAQSETAESQQLTELQEKENEAFGNMFSADGQQTENNSRSPNTFWLFFRTLLVLILVVAAIYAIFHLVKKSSNPTGKDSDPFIKKVASLSLAAGKTVQIVTVQDHCYVLGVSDDSVQLIKELDSEKDKDLIDAMNLHQDAEPAGKKKDFASMLANVMGVKKKTSEETVHSSVNSLKSLSKRLKKSSLKSEENAETEEYAEKDINSEIDTDNDTSGSDNEK